MPAKRKCSTANILFKAAEHCANSAINRSETTAARGINNLLKLVRTDACVLVKISFPQRGSPRSGMRQWQKLTNRSTKKSFVTRDTYLRAFLSRVPDYARVIRGGETFPGVGFLNFFSSFFFFFSIWQYSIDDDATTSTASVDGAIYIDGLFSLDLLSRSISSRLYPFLAILATTSG